MGYTTQYSANFKNEINQNINVSIAKKDGPDIEIPNYKVVSLKISDNSDEQDIYATIISKELELVLWTESADAITWETFITSAHDDWKVTVTDDSGNTYFVGFITPDEGHAPFQDKPYEVVIKATDGLGLLKGYELTSTTGVKLKGFYKLIEYLAGALVKTKLDLPIRVYCNIFHQSMQNKGDSMNNDLFQAVELNARTFLKDVNSYESCYDALKILLSGWCHIQQYNGKWQVITLSERQYVPGSYYYVDYSATGGYANGVIETEDVALVGKNELIYPINESQTISSKYANKQCKSIFEYSISDEFVNNQKLQQLGELISTVKTPTLNYKTYALSGWTHYKGSCNSQATYTGTAKTYIRVDYDAYDTQIDRYYVIENDAEHSIRHDNVDFYVDEGDRMSVSIDMKTNTGLVTGNYGYKHFVCRVSILKNGASGINESDWYSLDPAGKWSNDPFQDIVFVQDVKNTLIWGTYSVNEFTIPVSGQMFIYLNCDTNISGLEIYLKELNLSYSPYFRGAKFNIKSDYHLNAQNAEFPDKFEQTLKISDSPKRLVKGSFFWTNSVGSRLLLDPAFYRYPNTFETKNFKQLANYGKFNHTYRRFYKIEGDFTSIVYNTASDQNLRKPLGFHKRYRFTDMNPVREFVLEPSLEMDMVTGNVRATFVEVYKDINDGQSTGDVDKFDYIF